VKGKWSFIAGRKGAMALSTLLSGVFLFLFTQATTNQAVLGWNCASALTQNAMYGILYAYTPEVFPTSSRGSGNAICASLNRMFGIIAPLLQSVSFLEDS
jgi:MFS family permease